MSRTFKDRPYWVKNKDKTLNRRVSHEHEKAGAPVYESFPLLDENGEQVLKTKTHFGVVGYRFRRFGFYQKDVVIKDRTEAHDFLRSLLAKEPEHRDGFNSLTSHDIKDYVTYGDVTYTYKVTENLIVGYRPTECTIDSDLRTDWNHYDPTKTLCYSEHVEDRRRGCGCCTCKPSPVERKAFHTSKRAAEGVSLHKLVKEINNGYDSNADAEEYYDVLYSHRNVNRRFRY